MSLNSLNILEEKTIQWSKDRGIIQNGNVKVQMLKLVGEIGELADHIAKGTDIKDDVGDCLVLLTNIANMSGTNLTECWKVAYNDIKDRKGFLTKDGAFIKEKDKQYQIILERENND